MPNCIPEPKPYKLSKIPMGCMGPRVIYIIPSAHDISHNIKTMFGQTWQYQCICSSFDMDFKRGE